MRRPGRGWVTAGLAAGIAGWNLVQNRLAPRWSYVWLNLAGTAGAVALGRRLGLTRADLGIDRAALPRGLRVGGALAGGAAAVVAAGAAGERTRELFRDARAEGASAGRTAYEVGVRIPLGTALFEETLFRGLLLGWLARAYGTGTGVAGSSLAFGLWHIAPTWETAALYRGGRFRERGAPAMAGVLAGAVAATTAAGGFFSLLRLRTGSLAAPVILHAAVNGAGFLAARHVTARP